MNDRATGYRQWYRPEPGEPAAGAAGSQEASRTASAVAEALRQHEAVCAEVWKLVQEEHSALTGSSDFPAFSFHQRRKVLLPRLDESLRNLRRWVAVWQSLPPAERERFPELVPLLRSTQDLIMRVIVMDRESEQVLLRRGLFAPREVPPARSQQPHFVADLYRRHTPPPR